VDNREAKFILNAYRPGGQDANDPRFAESLEQARRDPILERWFSESIAFDAAITEKLGSVPVPAELRDNILAGAKVSRPSRWPKPLLRWAIAAALFLTTIAGSLMVRELAKPRLAGWQSESLAVISSLVKNQSKFDAEAQNASDLVSWLQAHHAPVAEKFPRILVESQSIGCKKFFWNGEPVSVICFMRSDGRLIHLVVTNAAATSDRARTGEPKLVQRGGWATATWREGNMVCMLALEGSRDQLDSYLL
jgi:hypothetical protein